MAATMLPWPRVLVSHAKLRPDIKPRLSSVKSTRAKGKVTAADPLDRNNLPHGGGQLLVSAKKSKPGLFRLHDSRAFQREHNLWIGNYISNDAEP